MDYSSFVLSLTFPCLLAIAAAQDLARFRIANSIPLAVVLFYIPASLLSGAEFEELVWHACAALAVLAAAFMLFSFHLLGGGDAKLLAAAACWTGFSELPELLVITAIAGGGVAILFASIGLALKASSGRQRFPPWLERLRERPRDIPYGLAIAIGGVAVFPHLDLVQRILHH